MPSPHPVRSMADDYERRLIEQAAKSAHTAEVVVVRLEARFEAVVKDVERHRSAIFGRDGNNGLNNRVGRLEDAKGSAVSLDTARAKANEAHWVFWAKIVGLATLASGFVEGIGKLLQMIVQ